MCVGDSGCDVRQDGEEVGEELGRGVERSGTDFDRAVRETENQRNSRIDESER